MRALSQNKPRWARTAGAHVESYFVKANDQNHQRALWLKLTCLNSKSSPSRLHKRTFTLWFCWFDAHGGIFEGARYDIDESALSVNEDEIRYSTNQESLTINEDGGHFTGQFLTRSGPIELDLSWSACPSPKGSGYGMFPYSWMLKSSLPKQKTLTPIGLALCDGEVRVLGQTHAISNWVGCQGHNWGRGHTPGYTWTQGVFVENGQVVATCEAFSGFAKIAGCLMGPFSGMVIRTQDEEFRFDRLVDRWNHRVEQKPGTYEIQLKKGRVRASLSVKAQIESAVCLGYDDPDGMKHFCWNSKLASSTLTIESPTRCLEYQSQSTTALEWLSSQKPENVI